jgi:hypothetical protein
MLQNNWQKPAGKGLDEVFKWSPLLIKVISGPFNSSPVSYIRSLVDENVASISPLIFTNLNEFIFSHLIFINNISVNLWLRVPVINPEMKKQN